MHHPAPTAIMAARLTYRGGALITAAQVFTVFWGNLWGTTATSSELIGKINKFFTDILVSPLVDQLAEYNVSGQKIEHGTFAGSKAAPRQRRPPHSVKGEQKFSQTERCSTFCSTLRLCLLALCDLLILRAKSSVLRGVRRG
jgi:hypothetical protein